jgi:hypothetical protein
VSGEQVLVSVDIRSLTLILAVPNLARCDRSKTEAASTLSTPHDGAPLGEGVWRGFDDEPGLLAEPRAREGVDVGNFARGRELLRYAITPGLTNVRVLT